MKHFVYSAICYHKNSSSDRPMFANGLFEGSMTELYEMAIKQPESWCFTHVAEISDVEYYEAKEKGTIG